MKLTPRLRFWLRLQHATFVVLLLAAAGLLAWLSTRHVIQADWTRDNRHSLSETSRMVLAKLDGPLSITAYASEASQLREPIRELLARYRRAKPDLSVRFVDPNSAPGEVREKDINADGELLIEYQDRAEHLSHLNEQGLTQALQRVLRREKRWLAFIEGHGERNPLGQANHDYGYLGQHLKSRGFNLQPLSLAQNPIPDNTSVLVLAGPRMNFLPAEVEAIARYLEHGGNLLWLLDPGPWHGLEPLAGALGLSAVPGVLHDPASQRLLSQFGGQNPAMLLLNRYPEHPVTRRFPPNMLVLLPEAAGLRVAPPARWEKTALLEVGENAWAESGEAAKQPGPFEVGVLLTRLDERPSPGNEEIRQREQRVAILGDGDFLANSYLENSGNLDLGLSLFEWLAEDDELLEIPAKIASDRSLHLSYSASLIISFAFLLVLPLGLLATGLLIWLKRRKA
jgi:ABC-type uncharacterized transport system involved in gliding motility auxiliary subunit